MVADALFRLWRILPLPASLRWALASLAARRYRVAVAAVILDPEGHVLLCEHTYRRTYPWGLPGGDLEPGEEPARAIEREILEETGLQIRATRLLLATNARECRHVALIFLGEWVGGTFHPSAEVSAARFFASGSLPALLPTERGTLLAALRLLTEGQDQPAPN